MISGAVVFFGCKSAEKASDIAPEPNYEFRCSGPEYTQTGDYFRVHKIGQSVDQATSITKAIRRGQQDLAESIQSVLRDAIENYLKDKGLRNDQVIGEEVSKMIEQTGNNAIKKVDIVCEESIKTMDGLYRSYIVLEISINEVFNELQKYAAHKSQIQFDINIDEFRIIFREEMIKRMEKSPDS